MDETLEVLEYKQVMTNMLITNFRENFKYHIRFNSIEMSS